MARLDVVRRGPERLRVGSWRGDARVAYVAPVSENLPPTTTMVLHCCELLSSRGFGEVLTGALAPAEQQGFLAAGFTVREELDLLAHDLSDLPGASPIPLRRAGRADRPAALDVDHRAFPPFWRLDPGGLDEAVTATPTARFRVACGRGAAGVACGRGAAGAASGRGLVVGYAVTGRAGRRGYLQRLAVRPEAQGRGIGRALAVDGLRWLRRRGAEGAVVNTQVGNEDARRLYLALGFRLQAPRLAVLGCRLGDRQLTP